MPDVPATPPQAHGIRIDGSRFWVVHRRSTYGPFDYEWSKDLYGVELLYDGKKFGEYVSDAEIFADLKEFSLPATVVEVSSVVLGCIVFSVLHGLSEPDRLKLIRERLDESGHEKFAVAIANAPS